MTKDLFQKVQELDERVTALEGRSDNEPGPSPKSSCDRPTIKHNVHGEPIEKNEPDEEPDESEE